eukprot:comp19752_c0_seq1/m.38075 comp19752_c0_seq1/g.38075  ORF comp19752_c0_seq1/g.38075 comp19752_c0_seq1/m.38075 type:complete len:113 (+) comp19752_c0_seq1:182-520(+)
MASSIAPNIHFNTLNTLQSSHNVTLNMLVPTAALGVIIGRQGTNLARIKQQTNTNIIIRQHENEPKPNDTPVSISGHSSMDVENARMLICHKIKRHAQYGFATSKEKEPESS